ncbi:MAG: hypothetical protein OXE78_02530 [Gammaproteobacteria bacterium]|nr:hypothetical protein [Gammaproteobacteria bacterium]MCY4358966.1 hypothetical protein [Gammaproteobacteria bacterium]
MPTATFPAQSQGQPGSPTSSAQTSQQAGGQSQGKNQGGLEPGQNAGADTRFPASQGQTGQGTRVGATEEPNNGQSGAEGRSSGGLGSPSGDYGLDTLPNTIPGGVNPPVDTGTGSVPPTSGNTSEPSATENGRVGSFPPGSVVGSGTATTSAERAAKLDDLLRQGYETFDGFILSERERAQTESNAAGSINPGANGAGSGSGSGSSAAQNQPQFMEPTGSDAQSTASVASNGPPVSDQAPADTFPPPDDIPSGRDDDVVARQIREAAMAEPDPELREALWDEYRAYTGLGEK